MTRSRADSTGGTLRHRGAPELVECDGVNLYERAAPSAAHEAMLVGGRERIAQQLARPIASDAGRRPANRVVWLEELSEGTRTLDKFRVTSESPDGFTHAERSALERLAHRTIRGASDTVVFVLVDHQRYDTRLCVCCDLSLGQIVLLALLYAASVALGFYVACELVADYNSFLERAVEPPVDSLDEVA
jgi:hypothetical protein